jgi:uncharacterized repeat protein (TIGR04052 family)
VEKLIMLVLLSLGVACAPATTEIDIPFSVLYNGKPISCDTPADSASMTDLRFYIHDLRLLGPGSQENPIALRPDDLWQTEAVALLDFENGKGACINGSERTNTTIRGRHNAAEVRGLSFRIGVPEHLNHENALTAKAPLNFTDMHWHWASGYKFLRAGIETQDDGFWIHLGSSQCEGTIGDIKGCRASNRPDVILTEFSPGTDRVVIDLAGLFAEIDLGDGAQSDCSSGPTEMTCVAPFGALGLDFATGRTVRSAAFFQRERIE